MVNVQSPWGGIYSVPIDSATGRALPEEHGPLLFGRSTKPWKLLSVMVSQTRYWACSSAQFTLVRPILTPEDKILALNVTNPSADNYFDLRPEDPVIIELGYANSLFNDNPSTRNRVFFGYVDTIKVTANSRGIKVVVSCRDPMRFIIDNKFSGSIVQYNGKPEQKQGESAPAPASQVTGRLVPRAGIYDKSFVDSDENIKNLDPEEVNRALKGLDNEQVNENKNLFYNNGDDKTDITIGDMDKHKILAWLIYAGSNGACLPAPLVENENTYNTDRDTTGKDPKVDEPSFEKSTRAIIAPTESLQIVSGFNIMNKFPLEVIKHLGALEAEPRELYADVNTGRICWKRKRTYQKEPNERKVYSFLISYRAKSGQIIKPNIIASEVDWSTVGTVSEVVAVNPQADSKGGGEQNKSSGVVSVIGRLPDNRFYRNVIPFAYPGLKNFTRRTRFIFDDTINSDDTTNAENLVEAFLRIWGKDIRAGTITVPGDPEVKPGIAVELHNVGIFDDNPEYFRIEAVTHKMTAAGPNKGYRTLIGYAEADETRVSIMEEIYKSIGGDNPKEGKNKLYATKNETPTSAAFNTSVRIDEKTSEASDLGK